MPIARFELPDGRIGRFEVPEGTSQDDAMSLIEEHIAANPIAPSAQRPLPEGVTPSGAGAGRGSVVPHGPTLRERLFDRNVRSNVQPMKRRGGTRSEAKVFTPTGTDTTMSDVTGAVGDAIKGIAGMAAEKVIGVAGDMYNQEAPPEPPPSALDNANPLGYSRPLAYPQTPLEAASGASIRPGAEPRFQAAIDAKRAPAEATKMPIGASLAVDVRESTKNPVARGAAAGVAQLGQTGVGAVRLTADLFGADKVADFAADTDKTAKAFASGSTTDLRGSEKLVADVTASILNSAPAVAVGAVGGPAMRTLFAQSALAEYNEGRNAGFGTEESLKRAGIMGLAEAIGERAGFPEQIKLIKSLAKHIPTGELSKAFGSMLAKEIPGEQLTTAMQFMADKMGPAALSPDATLDQYLDQAGETLKVTIAQTAVMGGGPAAIGSTRNAIQNADQTIASTKPAQLDPQELIADAINQAASEFGLSAKAAVRLRDAAMERTGNQAVEMAARAMDEFERAGMTKKPGAKAGFLATLQQRVDAVKQEMEARAAAQPDPAPASPAAPVAEGAPPAEDFTGLDAPSEPVEAVPVAPPAPVDAAAHAAATSPENDLPEPTPAQKSAGNYRLGHTRIAGLNISIENPQGSERSGTDADGKAWSVRMNDHYGYIRSTVGKDGDHIDTFVKAGTPEDYDGGVLVIDQKSPNGRFDEHKVMIGYDDARQAIEAYRSNYDAGWDGVMSWHALDMPNFKAWLATGNHNQPAAKWKPNDISDVADASSAPVGSGDERGAAVARSGGDSRPVADERRMDRSADAPAGSSLPVEPVADGDRRDAALTPRILGRVGTTPATATPLELRHNADGTLTPWHEGHELLDFDSGDPVKLPVGMSDADA
ncbi:MAG: hypothetical protein K0Q92_2981, partial [Steroidobacteraceae bacterium]|nr:hypothetical protein [Steroidobacteraceae bacterium]